MKSIAISLSLFLANFCFAIDGGLYPEDGSMKMTSWVYSGGKTGPRISDNEILAIENAFRSEGVEPIVLPQYEWMQDMLFFDQNQNIVELALHSTGDGDDQDLTIGILNNEWGQNEVNFVEYEALKHIAKGRIQLKNVFLEGGQTITGKFENGDNYIIMYEQRFKGMLSQLTRKQPDLTMSQLKEIVGLELNIKADNIILLPAIIGSEHLDLYMKALPNGTILLDDPSARLSVINGLEGKFYDEIRIFESKSDFSYLRERYNKKIKIVKEILEEKFKVYPIAGRFFSYTAYTSTFSYRSELVNFFNGVSGHNENQFYITNHARGNSELERYWASNLEKFGFKVNHIHFVGNYSSGAGLDCMGSPL